MGRFISKQRCKKYENRINTYRYFNKHKPGVIYHHWFYVQIIIDTEGFFPTHEIFAHDKYYLDKCNKWDEARKARKRFFVCQNSNGHYQVVDGYQSVPHQKWIEWPIPKKTTAESICSEMNQLNETIEWLQPVDLSFNHKAYGHYQLFKGDVLDD